MAEGLFARLRKMVKTTAFQSSLLFALFFSILAIFAMLFVFRSAKDEMALLTDNHLRQKMIYYSQEFTAQPPPLNQVTALKDERHMRYCLVERRENLALANYMRDREPLLFNSDGTNLCQSNLRDNVNGAYRIIARNLGADKLLLIGHHTADENLVLSRMRETIIGAGLFLLALGFAGALLVSSSIIKIIGNIRHTARRIMGGNLSRRIPIPKNTSDEITRLAQDLNSMLERIETLINSQKQVTSNIAHDLRSPLNRMRNRMEVALFDRESDEASLRAVIEESINDCHNLLKTFNALLTIAQVESRARDDFIATDLSRLCFDLAELYEVLNEEESHHFNYCLDENLLVLANKHLVAQALTNLLDNAVKYTPPGGHISLQAKRRGDRILVVVADDGAGIPPEKFADVMKCFVRLDSARSTPGNGLGLALVKAVVELHGALLTMHDNRPGLRVEISFPVLEPAAEDGEG